jgi:hypothetical protein
VLFLVCDHFEPRHGARDDGHVRDRLATWDSEYPRFRERCRAEFGHAPRHTWFYPPHHGLENLSRLGRWTFEGHGEVELHYHHGNDDSASLRRGLGDALAAFNRHGMLLGQGAPPKPSFAFIHGDWALDNSGPREHCGVNDELSILRDLGCWADFTMPSANACQTRQTNSIYYAIDDPARPRSHDSGPAARAGKAPPDGLFLMQGPLGINWRAPRYPRIENASLTTPNWGRRDRIRQWLSCHVHVRGRPDWVFVKLHTHGAIDRDHDALFGERAFALHRMLNEEWNDGERYRLHYLTAREAFNVARAAELGRDGDPASHRDLAVAPSPATRYWLEAGHRVVACDAETLEVGEIEGGAGRVEVRFRDPSLERVAGPLASFRLGGAKRRFSGALSEPSLLEVEGRGRPPESLHPEAKLLAVEERGGGGWRAVVQATGPFELALDGAGARS